MLHPRFSNGGIFACPEIPKEYREMTVIIAHKQPGR